MRLVIVQLYEARHVTQRINSESSLFRRHHAFFYCHSSFSSCSCSSQDHQDWHFEVLRLLLKHFTTFPLQLDHPNRLVPHWTVSYLCFSFVLCVFGASFCRLYLCFEANWQSNMQPKALFHRPSIGRSFLPLWQRQTTQTHLTPFSRHLWCQSWISQQIPCQGSTAHLSWWD